MSTTSAKPTAKSAYSKRYRSNLAKVSATASLAPNGAGKSTFLKIISGELEPDSGHVHKPERTGVLKQDQFGFEKMIVLSVVLMGNHRLWAAMQEKEELLAKETLTDKQGELLGELEGVIAEEDGYSAESDAAELLAGLGIPESEHEKQMRELPGRP